MNFLLLAGMTLELLMTLLLLLAGELLNDFLLLLAGMTLELFIFFYCYWQV